MSRRSRTLTAILVAVLVGSTYCLTLHPGVGDGDAAELQFNAPLLGLCHPPGYPFVVLAGKLFTTLPLGGDAAWRVNLMTAAFGVVGVLFLYAALVRMTGCVSAAAVGALTLAFSSIYWSHSIAAEVYSFCGALLLAGVYSAVRFFLEGRAAWLFVATALLGACVISRPSELFVLPAFGLAWFAFRGQARLTIARVAIAAACAAAPLGLTVAYYAWRENPAHLNARDDALRDKAVEDEPLAHELTGGAWLADALRFSLGLKWATRAPTVEGQFTWDASKYAWLLSGAGAFADRYSESDAANWRKRIAQGRGTSIGALGLIVAGLGCWFGRRNWGWVALGAGMFLGNTVFYFWHHPPDNLEFTLPGLAGVAILVGLGAAGWTTPEPEPQSRPAGSGSLRETPKRRRNLPLYLFRVATLLVPAFLLLGNFKWVTESGSETAKIVSEREAIAAAPWPENAVIVAPYPRAMTCRYVLHIRGGRKDLRIISLPGWYSPEQRARLGDFIAEQSAPVFLSASLLDRNGIQSASNRTPVEIVRHGFFRFRPE